MAITFPSVPPARIGSRIPFRRNIRLELVKYNRFILSDELSGNLQIQPA